MKFNKIIDIESKPIKIQHRKNGEVLEIVGVSKGKSIIVKDDTQEESIMPDLCESHYILYKEKNQAIFHEVEMLENQISALELLIREKLKMLDKTKIEDLPIIKLRDEVF